MCGYLRSLAPILLCVILSTQRRNQPARPLVASVVPLHVQVGDAEDKGIDEHEGETCKLEKI